MTGLLEVIMTVFGTLFFIEFYSWLVRFPLFHYLNVLVLILVPIYIIVRHFLQKIGKVLPPLPLPFKKSAKNGLIIGFIIGNLFEEIAIYYVVVCSTYIIYSILTGDKTLGEVLKNS